MEWQLTQFPQVVSGNLALIIREEKWLLWDLKLQFGALAKNHVGLDLDKKSF